MYRASAIARSASSHTLAPTAFARRTASSSSASPAALADLAQAALRSAARPAAARPATAAAAAVINGLRSTPPSLQRRSFASPPSLPSNNPLSTPLPTPSSSSPLSTALPPKRRSLLRKLLRLTLLSNALVFGVLVVGGGAAWVYWSYVVPAKTVYRRGKDGYTYAVGVYDSTRSAYSSARGWYGWLFLGERGSTADVDAGGAAGDEVVGVKDRGK